jgi:hypothetical protein
VSYLEDVSYPRITWTNTTGPIPAVVSLDFTCPVKFRVVRSVVNKVNRANSGIRETLTIRSEEMIEMEWEFLGLGGGIGTDGHGITNLLQLWESCKDGTPFTIQRHQAIGSTGYPTGFPPYKVHKNVWTVRFHPSMKEFPIETQQRVKDRYPVKLTLEEVITG